MDVMAAPVSIRVKDHGDRRSVTVAGPHYVMGQLRERSEFESRYSSDLLERLADLKAGHLWDEILRLDNAEYIEGPLASMFERFGVDITGTKVLDCGSGAGASSILMLRQGAAHVYGVEVVAQCVEVARLRAAEEGCGGQVDFLYLEDPPHVPRQDGSVDVVLANALLEHIPPEARPGHLQEWWRLLRPGGFLLLRETPNRLWPKDGHTSGLWWVPYMPLPLARWYAAARSPRVSAGASMEELIVAGIRGATYWEIIRPLPAGELIEWNRRLGGDVESYFRLSLAQPGEGRVKRSAKRMLQGSLASLERLLLRPLGIPACALLPYLTICLQKRWEPGEVENTI